FSSTGVLYPDGFTTKIILSSPTGRLYSPLAFVCTTSRPLETATLLNTFSRLSRLPFLLLSSYTTPLAKCCALACSPKSKKAPKTVHLIKLFFIVRCWLNYNLVFDCLMDKDFER